MSSSDIGMKFSVGDHIVYPLQGVGIIKCIEERNFQGEPQPYYVIHIAISDMIVKIPIAKAAEMGIRAIVPPSEAQEAIDSISSKYDPLPVDWKTRYQMNVDLLQQGSIASIAQVVQALYHRSKVKELPVQERKLYDGALRLLIDEVSFSLKRPEDEIEKLIFSRLEKK